MKFKNITRHLSAGFFITIFSLVILPAAHAAAPSDNWKTLESEHFKIHTLAEHLAVAKRIGVISERLHSRLSKVFNWQSKDKIRVVVTDEHDLANGSATPLPYNTMTIRLSPADKVSRLDDYDDWLSLLIEHELVHILHLDKGHGKIKKLRQVFGRFVFLFPNIFQPSWFIEGLATFHETHKGVGRGQSNSFEMFMREEVEKGILPVATVNLPPDSQPLSRHYLYGVYFYQFLNETYGYETVHKMIASYSDNIIPFAINSNSKRVFGKDVTTLWAEFSVYLKKRFSTQIALLNQSELKLGKMFDEKAIALSNIDTLDEQTIVYIEDDLESLPYLVSSVGGKKQSLVRVNRNSYFDVGSKESIYISQPEYCDEYRFYYDLYRYDVVNEEITKLTECSRYKHIVASSDNKLLAVKTIAAIPQIDLLDKNAKLIKTLWKGKYGDVISDIDWSEKRNSFLVTKKQLNQSWNIYEIDLLTQQWVDVIAGEAVYSQAKYNQDQDGIIFSSDRSGVYNIYKKSFSKTNVMAVTNVGTGAFSPLTYNDQLYYQKFSRHGYQLLKTDLKPAKVVKIKEIINSEKTASLNQDDARAEFKLSDYSPLEDLKPAYWFPIFSFQDNASSLGFTTSSQDSLLQHGYQLSAIAGIDQEDLSGNFSYYYQNWLSLRFTKENTVYSDPVTDLTTLIRTNVQSQINFSLPVTKLNAQWRFSLGLIESHDEDTYRAPGVTGFNEQNDGLLGLSIYFNSKKKFMKSHSAETGRDVLLVSESSDVFNSDFSGVANMLDWREYFNLGGHHNLALRYVVAEADLGMRAYKLGGLKNDWENYTILNPRFSRPVFNKRNFALRGYSDNTQIGNNLELFSAEWRFPLLHVEKGIMAPPVGIIKHSGRLFAEAGASWTDNQQKNIISSAGLEWLVDLNLFYRLTPQIRFGYAKALDDIEDEVYYLKVGGSF